MKSLTVPAELEELKRVKEFVLDCAAEVKTLQSLSDIELVTEEIFVNIARYGYVDSAGTAQIECDRDSRFFSVRFTDSGEPFNPLKHDDPDVNAPLAERQIGGLGIMLVRKIASALDYQAAAGKNIFTVSFEIENTDA